MTSRRRGALVLLAAIAAGAAWLAMRGGRIAPGPRKPERGPAVHRIETVMVGEIPRAIWLHVPSRRDEKAPLVLEFHGWGSSALQQAEVSRFDALADTEGFIVARPEGYGAEASFNAGKCCGDAVERKFDDVQLARAVIAHVAGQFGIDRAHVYAVGFSNGGMLSQTLACAAPEELAAVASIGGALVSETCQPKRAISVLEIHGTEDRLVGYTGGGLAAFPPVQETMHGWAARQRCAGVKADWPLDERETFFQSGNARCERYQGCADGAEVALCRLAGAGHTWPGGPEIEHLGKTSRDLDATEFVWRFFSRH